jgi:hypothetical protein
VVDVIKDPLGKSRLLELGAATVPVLARGDEYIFCQNIEDLAEFVGLHGSGHTPLPPAALIPRWITVLEVAKCAILQIPPEALGGRAIESRDRSVRLLAHHIFRIGEAFLEVVIDRVEYQTQLANVPPLGGTFTTVEEIAGYGGSIARRIENWWSELPDKSCQWPVQTFYGAAPAHQLLERSTWHSAQHCRQMIAVLERFHIAPARVLGAEDLAGLPLPEGLWD